MGNGIAPRYAAYETAEKRVGDGVVRTHIPRRTPEEQAAFLRGVDKAIRGAFPGWRLRNGVNGQGNGA